MEEKIEEIRKILEDMENINNKVNLYDEIWDLISCYDEEYSHEQGIDELDGEDVYNIVANILNRNDVQDIMKEELESYAGQKKYSREMKGE